MLLAAHTHTQSPALPSRSFWGSHPIISVFSPRFLGFCPKYLWEEIKEGEKRETKHTENNYKFNQIKKWKQILCFEMNHLSILIFIQLELKGIPFPPHLHTTLCGRRANAPAIFSTKSLGRARIPMPKETTTTPASAASTQRRRPCGKKHIGALKSCGRKALPTVASASRKLSMKDDTKSTWSTKLRGFHQATNSKTAVVSAPSQAEIT